MPLVPILLALVCCAVAVSPGEATSADGPGTRHRVLVSTDIGGTDPDDLQSMVHLLVSADAFDLEGIVSSPFGDGRKEHILQVIDHYERDFDNLRTHSALYPSPGALRAIVKQGATEGVGFRGFGAPSEGSEWIVRCARRHDPRPLWVLVWGGIDDLAQALHDAPDILPKLRVYFIGGPNKKWSADAYQYIADHHPDLWIIEANATYRGWFTGGNQDGSWGNEAFVAEHVAGHGSLGGFFAGLLDGVMKMGDTPSVAYMMRNATEDPSRAGWGGRFVRAWRRPHLVLDRLSTVEDHLEQFGILEMGLSIGEAGPAEPSATMEIGNQSLPGFVDDDNRMWFRFSPKNATRWSYTIRSNVPALDGKAGGLTSFRTPPEAVESPSPRLSNWWTDDPSPDVAEGPHPGARTVSRWREEFLQDFAERMLRCQSPASPAARPAADAKPRVFVLTDIENEPDDAMSMVRFLTYANQFDIEGLVATTSIHQPKRTAPDRIRRIVDAYGEVRDNLEAHESGFPTHGDLVARISEGLSVYGMQGVGDDRDSPGSEMLIRAVDRNESRPLWVCVWGGPNVLAQALWKVRATRSAEELEAFVARLRVYAISDQDDSGPWIRESFPGLFYVVSPGFASGGAYHHATWSGISGDTFHGRFAGADSSLVSNEWLDRAVRRKGPLGAEYPRWKYLMEGDTPSFLNLIDNGLSDPERPDWGGWGGRYELYTPRFMKWHLRPESRPIWSDAEDEVLGSDGRWHTDNHATIWRWREAYQNDFAARMDWTVQEYGRANHPPVPMLAQPAEMSARPGDRVHLSARGSSDPDGDALSYEWFYYNEAGTFPASSARSGQPISIQGFDQPDAWFDVPSRRVMPPGEGTMHIILAVTDHGVPRLTRYRRVIVTVTR